MHYFNTLIENMKDLNVICFELFFNNDLFFLFFSIEIYHFILLKLIIGVYDKSDRTIRVIINENVNNNLPRTFPNLDQ